MLRILSYLISQGIVTQETICPDLDAEARGLPALTDAPCQGVGCKECVEICPTTAIEVKGDSKLSRINLDLGACIGCGLCIEKCPTHTIVENKSTRVATKSREDLILTNDQKAVKEKSTEPALEARNIFSNSVHARVVSTGCSACDLEIGAAGNPVFDLERFGIHIVASPRFADALLITGPVSKGMQEPLRRCYEAMSEPRVVIAVGTCAISGGVHKGGYAEANGANSILPVDVYIPGCPPHPWSIIHGVLVAMGKMEPANNVVISSGKQVAS